MAYAQCEIYSKILKKNVNLNILLPSATGFDIQNGAGCYYKRPRTVYKTLYLLHGSFGDGNEWVHFSNLRRFVHTYGMAVVIPSVEFSFSVNMEHGEHYTDYVACELPELLGSVFPLSEKREDTFIGGLSMGGYGAYRCALEYPERYKAAVSLSGALDAAKLERTDTIQAQMMPESYRRAVFKDFTHLQGTSDDLVVLMKNQLRKGAVLPEFLMLCGTEDILYECNNAFYEQVKDLKADIEYRKYPGAHDWDFWDKHMIEMLNWLSTAK